MGRSHRLVKLLCAVALAAGGALWLAVSTNAAGEDSITGVVRSASGAEAGVWVIAETDELETLFRKIVVTNDDGRFLIPDLPEAAYTVWVRGYGLVDSAKAPAHAGDDLALDVVAASTPREAAAVYPANYWYSLLEIPGTDEFPGTGPSGNGISPNMRTQAHWIDRLKVWMSAVPSDGPEGHPRSAEPGGLRFDARCVAQAGADRRQRCQHDEHARPHGPRAGRPDVRGLD